MSNLDKIEALFLEQLGKVKNSKDLEILRTEYLGKKGYLQQEMSQISSLEASEKKIFGERVNKVKSLITENIEALKQKIEHEEINAKIASESIDVSLPPRDFKRGYTHPITKVIDDVTNIFGSMGFDLKTASDIETEWHNFTALNIAENHPARQMHDTFYLESGLLLRTHTSSVQIRAMLNSKPPFKIISPGRTYRSDSDATHTPMFHQIEGLYIDKNIDMGHLKGCLVSFLEMFFEMKDIPVRFRPSYFPFTEPSAELDIGCSRKNGELVIGKNDDWLEILGCGMVHPNVLKNVGIDSNEYQGFAFGIGIERLAMLKYGIPDLRALFANDIRWLMHHGF